MFLTVSLALLLTITQIAIKIPYTTKSKTLALAQNFPVPEFIFDYNMIMIIRYQCAAQNLTRQVSHTTPYFKNENSNEF